MEAQPQKDAAIPCAKSAPLVSTTRATPVAEVREHLNAMKEPYHGEERFRSCSLLSETVLGQGSSVAYPYACACILSDAEQPEQRSAEVQVGGYRVLCASFLRTHAFAKTHNCSIFRSDSRSHMHEVSQDPECNPFLRGWIPQHIHAFGRPCSHHLGLPSSVHHRPRFQVCCGGGPLRPSCSTPSGRPCGTDHNRVSPRGFPGTVAPPCVPLQTGGKRPRSGAWRCSTPRPRPVSCHVAPGGPPSPALGGNQGGETPVCVRHVAHAEGSGGRTSLPRTDPRTQPTPGSEPERPPNCFHRQRAKPSGIVRVRKGTDGGMRTGAGISGGRHITSSSEVWW